jgi:hypothetical protein
MELELEDVYSIEKDQPEKMENGLYRLVIAIVTEHGQLNISLYSEKESDLCIGDVW